MLSSFDPRRWLSLSPGLSRSMFATLIVGAVVSLLSYLANNPSYGAISGPWSVSSAENLPQTLAGRIFEGLTFDIDPRGLMFDPDGSSFSFLIVDIGCGRGCLGLIDNFHPSGHGFAYRMTGPDPNGRYSIALVGDASFTIERLNAR